MTTPQADKESKRLRRQIPLVTIHGMKGSVLTREDGQVVWLTGAQAAGLSTPNIKLPSRWVEGVQDHDGITATHTLKAVTVIPYLVGASLYESWLAKAKSLGCPSYEFCYDWRRSCCEAVVKFAAYLRWVSAKHNGVKVQVVAHSMGGLIATATCGLFPDLFHSLVCAAVPFRGGPGLLFDMHIGTPTGRNMEILSPRVLVSFPSAHTICHLPGEHDDSSYSGLVDRNNRPISIDWFEVEEWRKYRFAIFSDEHNEPAADEEVDALRNALTDAKKFRALVVAQQGVSYPPMVVIASDTVPTMRFLMKDGPKSVHGYDFTTCPLFPGDGRVPLLHARPAGIPHEFVKSQLQHDSMLNDDRIPGILQRLVEEVSKSGEPIYNPKHPRL